jgi:2-dehydro-3-deoxyglucarate aldolase
MTNSDKEFKNIMFKLINKTMKIYIIKLLFLIMMLGCISMPLFSQGLILNKDTLVKNNLNTNQFKDLKLKERLSKGDILKGVVINISHPTMIEAVCAAGADFLFLDFEHGLRDYNDIGQCIIAAELSHVPALVRMGERSSNIVERMLDGGASGFLFSHVETAEEAAELVSWCRYKPLGVRGSGFARASLNYVGNEYDRRQQASKDVVCIMIVENLKGKENLVKILAVDGVTGVAIGPGDMSMELGVKDWKDPKVVKVLNEMAAVAKSFPDRALLRLALTSDDAVQYVATGTNMLLLTHDVQLIKSMYSNLFKEINNKISLLDRNN